MRGLVFIDSQWAKTGTVLRDSELGLDQLPRVRMNSYETTFWRFQTGMDSSCLATIEAVYYMLREVIMARSDGKYDGGIDDLMWLYKHQYDFIQDQLAAKGQTHSRLKHWAKKAKKDDSEKEEGVSNR